MRLAAALLSGFVFGAGLAIADMTNPAKVQNFPDLLGSWDPSLAFVLAMLAGIALHRLLYLPLRRPPRGLKNRSTLLGVDRENCAWLYFPCHS